MNRFLIVALLLCLQGISSVAHAEARKAEPKAGTEWTEPKTGMEFVWVPSGCFQMGGTDWGFQSSIHKVCVKGFWMGKYEVTQAQYQQVTGTNPSKFRAVNNLVETVSWDDAANFSARMAEAAHTPAPASAMAMIPMAGSAADFGWQELCGKRQGVRRFRGLNNSDE